MTTNNQIFNKIHTVVSPKGSTEIDLSKLINVHTDGVYHKYIFYINYVYNTGYQGKIVFFNSDDRQREFNNLIDAYNNYKGN